MNIITFTAGLIRKDELKQSASGHTYLRLSLAKDNGSYQDKKTNEWVNHPATFTNVTLFGKQATLFAQSNIPIGSRLIVLAEQSARVSPAYTNKDGIEVPERVEETYNIKEIGAAIGHGRFVSVHKAEKNNQATAQAYAQTPQTQSAAAPAPQQAPASTSFDDDFLGFTPSYNVQPTPQAQPAVAPAPQQAPLDEDDIFA